MPATAVLMVDDDVELCALVAEYLHGHGYDVTAIHDGAAGLRAALSDEHELVVLDVMLPVLDGFEVLRQLRQRSNVPVIMLTARAEEGDKVAGLEGGADDYITKPFSPRELLARINAVLRRVLPAEGTERIDIEGLVLDQSSQRVSAGERTVALGPTEYRMLAFFMTHPERVYTREQLLDRVWGGNVYVEERTIDVHIRRLRKALEEFGFDRLIQTVRGSGYRFSARPL